MDAPTDPSSPVPFEAPVPPARPLVPPIAPAPAPVAATSTPVSAIAVPVEPPHSGLGIASVVLVAVVAIALFVTFAIAGILHTQQRGPRDPATMLVGLLTIALMGGDITALGLGIAALCQKNRKKLFGVLGVVFSGLIVLGTIGLIVLGLALKHRAE